MADTLSPELVIQPAGKGGPGLTPCVAAAASGTWELGHDGTLYPTNEYTSRLNFWLYSRQQDDLLVRFSFPKDFDSLPVHVHQSRLSWAGGALYEKFRQELVLGRVGDVTLRESDDPETFAIMKEFLYGMPVRLDTLSVRRLSAVAQSAHHWQLLELFRGVCIYLAQGGRIQSAEDLVTATKVVELPGTPEAFIVYFWDCVGRFFDALQSSEGGAGLLEESFFDREGFCNLSSTDNLERKLCPGLPELWPLAVAQGMTRTVIQAILRYSKGRFRRQLIEVVMYYVEPKMQNERMVCDIMQELEVQREDYEALTESTRRGQQYSSRALRALANSVAMRCSGSKRVKQSWQCRWPKTLLSFGSSDEFTKHAKLSAKSVDLTSKGTGMSGYELLCRRSLAVRLTKSRNRFKNVILRVEWESGEEFFNEMEYDLQVSVRVIDDGCQCVGIRGSDGVKKTCLDEASVTEGLRSDGWVILCIERECVDRLRENHIDSEVCDVSIRVDVAVVDSGS